MLVLAHAWDKVISGICDFVCLWTVEVSVYVSTLKRKWLGSRSACTDKEVKKSKVEVT